MNLVVIILLVIGIIAIIVSCVMTSDQNTEESVNPNLKAELTDADKKHLNKLTDNYVKEYSKKSVKDIVSNNIKDM